MTDLQRNALARDITSRLIRASHDELRILDKLLVRLEQLRSLSWTRRRATTDRDVDRSFHLVGRISTGAVSTRCDGSWWRGDESETSLDGPPLAEMCWECARRWAAGRDIELYALLDVARDLRTEDIANAALHEAARLEMIGGGS